MTTFQNFFRNWKAWRLRRARNLIRQNKWERWQRFVIKHMYGEPLKIARVVYKEKEIKRILPGKYLGEPAPIAYAEGLRGSIAPIYWPQDNPACYCENVVCKCPEVDKD